MQYSLSGTVLTKDLVTADGRVVASRGQIVGLAYRSGTNSRRCGGKTSRATSTPSGPR